MVEGLLGMFIVIVLAVTVSNLELMKKLENIEED